MSEPVERSSEQAHRAHNYYPLFDLQRFFLALLVAGAHEGIAPGRPANLGLQIFFAMSGWLIGGILLHTPPRGLTKFYFNRATRIWVPYYFAVILLLGVGLWRDPIDARWLEFAFYKLTYVYNLFGPPQLAQHVTEMPLDGSGNHFWSLCVEEQFYLFAPLLLVLLPKKAGKSIWLWVAVSAVTIYFDIFGAISLGVLAAVVRGKIGDFHRQNGVRFGFAAVAVALGIEIYFDVLPYEQVAPFFALAVVIGTTWEGKKNKVISFLGGLSYPFYLNHWIGSFAAHALLKPFGMRDHWVSHYLAISIALVWAVILYQAMDVQLMKNRKSWFTEKRAKVLTVVGFSMVGIGLVGAAIFYNLRA